MQKKKNKEENKKEKIRKVLYCTTLTHLTLSGGQWLNHHPRTHNTLLSQGHKQFYHLCSQKGESTEQTEKGPLDKQA